jgi:replicative DNA helicase
LRGSGKITDECNTVFFLSRDLRDEASADDKSKFFIAVKKHRRKGELVNTYIKFDKGDFHDDPQHFATESWWNK